MLRKTDGAGQLYLVWELTKASKEAGYPVGTRGTAASSMLCCLLGITEEVNPLPPHYRCLNCRGFTEFPTGISRGCGADLPDRCCPNCGAVLDKAGFDLPWETFFGLPDAPKEIDIDLNVAPEFRERAVCHLREKLGAERVLYGGIIETMSEFAAGELLEAYERAHSVDFSDEQRERYVSLLSGVLLHHGRNPFGLVLIPWNRDAEDFTPVQPVSDYGETEAATQLEYYHLKEDCLLKLDVLPHDMETLLKLLSDDTRVQPEEIPFRDDMTMELLRSDATRGIPEFGNGTVRASLKAATPERFEDLLRLCGRAHGTWEDDDGAARTDIISTRDDIFLMLLEKGVDRRNAYEIMERVRRGLVNRWGWTREQEIRLKQAGIPEETVREMERTMYLFPRAHTAVYTVAAWRLSWYKAHHPLVFYAAYFYLRQDEIDWKLALKGRDAVREWLQAQPDEERLFNYRLTAAEVVVEYLQNGFDFREPDRSRSDERLFRAENGFSLRLPIAIDC